MKKLIFVFVSLFLVVLIAGCGARQKTVRFNNEDNTTEKSETLNESVKAISESEEMDVTMSETDTEDNMEENIEMDIPMEGEDESLDEESEKTDIVSKGKLAVTSLDGAFLKTNLSYNVIKGTTSSDTHEISINGYKLHKYLPGQTQWDYIASTRFSTLKRGTNNYVLKSFDINGKEIDSLMFTIEYDAPVIPSGLPGVGANHWLALFISLMLSGCYTIYRKYKWL